MNCLKRKEDLTVQIVKKEKKDLKKILNQRDKLGLKFNNIIDAFSLRICNIQNEHSQKWQA